MSKCIVCGAPLMEEPLLVCKNMTSSAQDMPTKEELDSDVSLDLRLCQCSGCGLVQFDCGPVWYYRDVIRAGGYSTTMKQLRHEQYARFIEKCGLEGKKIIEIGCGQGEFLEELKYFPVEAYGIEHKDDLVEKARQKGLQVVKGFTETSDQLLENGPFDAFLSFNFLEHQPDPNTMLRCIYNNLTPDGCGLITVPCFEYMLENEAFYELLRDHIANYTEDTLEFLLRKNGFTVLDTRRVNHDTIEMIVRKRPRTDVSGLDRNRKRLYSQVHGYIDSRVRDGKKIALWGASHQGFTAASTMELQDKLAYIIDSAPFKQGRYSPVSHLPIVSPDHFFQEPVDCILIAAPGYAAEIAKTIRAKFGENVEIASLSGAEIEIGLLEGQKS